MNSLLDTRYIEIYAVKGSDYLGVITTLRRASGVLLDEENVVNISLRVADPEENSRKVLVIGSLLGGHLSFNSQNGEVSAELALGDLEPREASRHYNIELKADIREEGSAIFAYGKLFVRDTISQFEEDEDPILDSEGESIL